MSIRAELTAYLASAEFRKVGIELAWFAAAGCCLPRSGAGVAGWVQRHGVATPVQAASLVWEADGGSGHSGPARGASAGQTGAVCCRMFVTLYHGKAAGRFIRGLSVCSSGWGCSTMALWRCICWRNWRGRRAAWLCRGVVAGFLAARAGKIRPRIIVAFENFGVSLHIGLDCCCWELANPWTILCNRPRLGRVLEPQATDFPLQCGRDVGAAVGWTALAAAGGTAMLLIVASLFVRSSERPAATTGQQPCGRCRRSVGGAGRRYVAGRRAHRAAGGDRCASARFGRAVAPARRNWIAVRRRRTRWRRWCGVATSSAPSMAMTAGAGQWATVPRPATGSASRWCRTAGRGPMPPPCARRKRAPARPAAASGTADRRRGSPFRRGACRSEPLV